MIRLLLLNKAKINSYNEKEDKTALYYAVSQNHSKVVDLLINKSYSIDSLKAPLDYLNKKVLFLSYLTRGGKGRNIDDLEQNESQNIVQTKKKQEILEILLERNNRKNRQLGK